MLVPSYRRVACVNQWRRARNVCSAAQALLESVRVTTRRPTRPRFTGSVLPCCRQNTGAKSSDPGFQGRTPLRFPSISLIPHGGTRIAAPSSGQARDGPPAPAPRLPPLTVYSTAFWRSGVWESQFRNSRFQGATPASRGLIPESPREGPGVTRCGERDEICLPRPAPRPPSRRCRSTMWGTWASRLEYKTGQRGTRPHLFLRLNFHCRSPVLTRPFFS